MIITTISVSTSYTYNLGDYSNIRPEVHLTAQLESGDNHLEVMEKLQKETFVGCLQAIDTALEQNDRPAKFSHAPRWNAYRFRDEKLIAILPATAPQDNKYDDALMGYRKDHLEDIIAHKYPSYTVTQIMPDLCTCWSVVNGNVIFIGKYGNDAINEDDFPRYFGIAHHFSVKHRIWDLFKTEHSMKAHVEDRVLVDTTEMSIGDIEAIPEVKTLKEKWEEEMARYKQANSPSDGDDEDDPLDGDLDDEEDEA